MFLICDKDGVNMLSEWLQASEIKYVTIFPCHILFPITLTTYECSLSQTIIAEFQQRSIAQTGKRKALDEDNPEDEQVEEENYPTPGATCGNSESSMPALQFSLTDQTHDVLLQMFSKSAMVAEYDALQQQNSVLKDHTITVLHLLLPRLLHCFISIVHSRTWLQVNLMETGLIHRCLRLLHQLEWQLD